MFSTKGYHGTYKNSVHNILENGFWDSASGKDWLGSGVYFFDAPKGQSDWAISNAVQWAHKKWTDDKKPAEKYAVVCCTILCGDDYFLDLTLTSQMVYFSKMREACLVYCAKNNIEYPHNDGVKLDDLVIKFICRIQRVDLARKYDYIRFPRDKKRSISSRIPNCSILCVKNKSECIFSSSFEREGKFYD